MSKIPNPQCPKCGDTMSGPKLESGGIWADRLRYRCGCGFTTTTPTLDAQGPKP